MYKLTIEYDELWEKIFERASVPLKSIRETDITMEGHTIVPASCAYRGQDNLKCFIGALIPDQAYTPTMERMDYQWLARDGRLFEIVVPGMDEDACLNMCMDLQNIHDSHEPVRWKGLLNKLKWTYDEQVNP